MDFSSAQEFITKSIKNIPELDIDSPEEIIDPEIGKVSTITFSAKYKSEYFKILMIEMASQSVDGCIVFNVKKRVRYKDTDKNVVNYESSNLFNSLVIGGKSVIVNEDDSRVDFIREEFFPFKLMSLPQYDEVVKHNINLSFELLYKASKIMPKVISNRNNHK